MKKIAVFASGNGSNFEALVKSSIKLGYKVEILVCNNPNAYVIERANKYNIETLILSHKSYSSREIYEKEIIKHLKIKDVDLIVLAGFMRLFSKVFLNEYKGKIINIHPSLLPNYPGINAIEKAYVDKVKRFGVTVFYVDEGVDTGKIIDQVEINVSNESLDEITAMIHKLEHELYPKTVSKILRGLCI